MADGGSSAWHRAYLYFHEKILGELTIGEPSFALSYWDWDSCTDDPNDKNGRNRFPGEVFGFAGDTTNPLFDPTRAVGRTISIDPIFVGPTVMKPIMTAASFTEFGGSGNQELPRRRVRRKAILSRWDSSRQGRMASSTSGLPTDARTQLAAARRTWVRWRQPHSIRCSSPITPISTGCGTFGSQDAGHANPANPRWLTGQPFLFYDQAADLDGNFHPPRRPIRQRRCRTAISRPAWPRGRRPLTRPPWLPGPVPLHAWPRRRR